MDVVEGFDLFNKSPSLKWEKIDYLCFVAAVAREKIFRRQTTFVQYHTSAPLAKNRLLIWVVNFNLFL